MKLNDTLLEAVKLDLEVSAVPALMGEPGIGKSSFVEGLAYSMDTRAFTLACNQLADKADLTGARLVPYTKADGTESYKQVFYPHQMVQDAVDYAHENPRERPILFFDEINRTTSDVTSAVLTMITMRQLGREKLPENLMLMIAGNDKGNVTTLDDASLSRFSIYRVEPDAGTLIQILGDTINPWVRNVLIEHPEAVFQKSKPTVFAVDGNDDDDDDSQATAFSDLMDAGEEMCQLTTPRTIDFVSRWLNAASQNGISKLQEWLQTPTLLGDTQSNALTEMLQGHLGDTDFATYLLAEIAKAIATGQGVGGVNANTARKPQCWDLLKQATTVADLEITIRQLTEHERSGALVYSLFEKADNTRLIQTLAPATELEADHKRDLVMLLKDGVLDNGNVDALTGSTGTAAEAVRSLASVFLGS